MEKTQDAANLVIGRDKEEAEIRNTEQYTDNYNEIARLGLDAIGQREVIRGEINDLSKKLEATYVNTGEVDSRGMDALGGLAEHYNSLAGLLRDLQNLEVRDIYAGRQDNEFISAVGRAESYGVKPFDAEGWGDTGFYAAIALGAFAAYKVTKPIVSVLMGLYDAGRLSAGASKRAAGVVKTGIKAVKGRIKQVRERRKTKKV